MAEDEIKNLEEAKPEVCLSGRSLKCVHDHLIRIALDYNNPPQVFQANGKLVRLRHDGPFVRMESMDLDMLTSFVDELATLTRKRGKGKYVVLPSQIYVRNLLAQPGWPVDSFPRLEGIITCPTYSECGELIQHPGYHSGSRLWLDLDPELRIPAVPPAPSEEEISKAKALLLDDLLFDFPFEDEASKANAIALLLTYFVRRMVRGQVPLACIDAPVMGTGKGLLADALTMLPLGNPSSKKAQPENDAEWRKAISAALVELPQFVLFDNLKGKLDSGALEMLLTTEVWTDRILGKSEQLHARNRAIWLATANNLTVSGDLLRRVFWIRLDAKLEHPYERDHSTFRHPDLLDWLHRERSQCVWASLVLVQHWIARGRPPGVVTMASFQPWAEVLGGILDCAGITGFLKNSVQRRQIVDDDSDAWRQLCKSWWETHGREPVGVRSLFTFVALDELFPYVMNGKTDTGQRQRLGHLLKKVNGRVFDVFRIVSGNEDNSHRRQYHLEIIDGETPPPTKADLEYGDLLEPKEASFIDLSGDVEKDAADSGEEVDELEA